MAPRRAVSHPGQGTAPLDDCNTQVWKSELPAAALPREAAIDAESGPLEEIARLFSCCGWESPRDPPLGPSQQVFLGAEWKRKLFIGRQLRWNLCSHLLEMGIWSSWNGLKTSEC